MKIVLSLLVLTLSLFASAINFEKDLESAKQKAISQNKKLMIMYSTPTCPECNYMKKKVFKDEKVISYVNENFVPVVMDIKKDKAELPYEFIGIPTLFFANASDMKLVGKKIGGTRETQLLEILEKMK